MNTIANLFKSVFQHVQPKKEFSFLDRKLCVTYSKLINLQGLSKAIARFHGIIGDRHEQRLEEEYLQTLRAASAELVLLGSPKAITKFSLWREAVKDMPLIDECSSPEYVELLTIVKHDCGLT